MPGEETAERREIDDGDHAAGRPVRRVVFIGGLDDGRRTVEVLRDHPRVDLVGAFVLDERSGGGTSGLPHFRRPGRACRPAQDRQDPAARGRCALPRPDLIFVVGFSQIITREILDVPPMGVIGFHSAVLPDAAAPPR